MRFAGRILRDTSTHHVLTLKVATGTPTGTTVTLGVVSRSGVPRSGGLQITVGTAPTNTAPTVANTIPNQTATAGTAFSYAFLANTFADTDPGDTLTYTATQSDDTALPSWLSFAAATRTFSGTPTAADVGTVSVKVTASDGHGGSVSDTFDIVVSAAGVTVSTSALTVTEEDTTGNTYTVVLDSQPTANVTVTVAGHAGTDVTLTPSILTFTTTTWGTAQTVTVKAGNDTDTTNDTVTLTHSAASTDSNYGGITIGSVVVTVADNDSLTAPGAPTGLAATANGPSQIDLSWTAPATTGGSAITGYKIEVSPNGTSGWTDQVANTNSTATTYAHTGLGAGDTRHYRVSAINANGTGVPSNVDSATTGTTVPGAPTGLTATASGTTAINLSWSAPASTGGSAITGYKIEVSANGTSGWTDQVANTNSTATTYAHTGLVSGDTRHYRVSAINANGTGVPSNVDSATTGTTVPGAPTGLTATASGTTAINLSWSAPASTGGSAITGYKIEVSPNGTSGWTDQVANTNSTATTYAHTGLAAGDTRHYRVSAINANGTGVPSNVDSATTGTTVPGAPTGLTATASGTTAINLSWSAPASTGGSAITGYKIEVSPNGTSGWTDQVANTNSTATTYAHTGLAAGDTRHYRVSAINANGTGVPSNVDSATTGTTVPGAPTGLTATASGTTAINLSWSAPASTGGSAITGYKIEVSPNGTSGWTDQVANTNSTATTYAHTGLAAGDTRHYRVSAINANGTGVPSNVDSATTGTTVPGAPTGLTATASGTTAINLSWSAPASTGGSAITGYKIEVSANGTSGWTDQVANTNSTATTYAHTGLVSGDTRHYRVSAINANGTGVPSNVDSATTGTTVPGAPTGLTATASGTTAINLSWSAPASTGGSAITGYKIEVSPNGTSGWTDQVANTNSTATTYAHTGLAAGDTRHYRVSAINANGTGVPSNVDSATTASTNTAAMGAPTITGTAQVGQTLTAATTGITDADGLTSPTYTYQWIRVDGTDEADIAAANSSTYILGAADLGTTLTVRVTFADDLGHTETLTSAATATVGAGAVATAPTVTAVAVTSTPASGTTYYLAGDVIAFTVTFSAPVTVTGTPTFAFRLGAATRQAAYARGSDSAALVFARTVQAGEVDSNGISWNAIALALDGGTITQTGATTAARLTHAAQASLEGHRVDAAPPMQVSASVQGLSLVLVYDEPLDPASMPATGAYTVTATGGATTTTPAVSEVSIYGIWVTLTLDAAPAAGATVTLAYAPPASNPVQDEAGNDAPAFSGQSVRLGPPPPPPVTDLAQVLGVGVAPGNAQLVVTWTAVDTATGYTVQWMSGSQGYNAGDRQATVTSGSTTRYTIPSLINGTAYTVRVIATRTGATDGPPSAEMTGTPRVPPPPPPPVTDLAQVLGVGVAPGNAQLVVTWTAVDTATGYTVQWKSGGQGYNTGDRQATVTPGSTTSHTIEGLANGTEYTVRVIATRTDANDGPPSAEVTGTTEMIPVPTPTLPEIALLLLAMLLLGSGVYLLRGRQSGGLTHA